MQSKYTYTSSVSYLRSRASLSSKWVPNPCSRINVLMYSDLTLSSECASFFAMENFAHSDPKKLAAWSIHARSNMTTIINQGCIIYTSAYNNKDKYYQPDHNRSKWVCLAHWPVHKCLRKIRCNHNIELARSRLVDCRDACRNLRWFLTLWNRPDVL